MKIYCRISKILSNAAAVQMKAVYKAPSGRVPQLAHAIVP